jgi:hypothetical protein
VSLSVSEAPIVQQLQQHIEHLGVRLLDLIEQHDAIGSASDGFGELPALLIADIAGRRADEAGDGVALHVFTHVKAHQVALIIEEELGKCFCQLGFADACWSEEDEGADGAVRVG